MPQPNRLVPAPRRALGAAGLLAAGALALTACGGTAGPAPAPTSPASAAAASPADASATPSASPSPRTPPTTTTSAPAASTPPASTASTPPTTSAASSSAPASRSAAASPTATPSSTTPPSSPSTSPSARVAPTASASSTPAPTPTSSPSTRAGAPAGTGGHGRTNCALEFCVALTFDDGPRRDTTTEVLDALAARGASATFFVVGENAARNPDLLARMVSEGHEIGNHTYDHVDLRGLDWDSAVAQLEDTQDVVESATGVRPTLVRPPWGFHDADVDAEIEATGESRVLWNVDTMDWHHKKPEYVWGADVSRGDVVLMHDIHPTTSGAVGKLVDRLQAQGCVLVTVSDLRDG